MSDWISFYAVFLEITILLFDILKKNYNLVHIKNFTNNTLCIDSGTATYTIPFVIVRLKQIISNDKLQEYTPWWKVTSSFILETNFYHKVKYLVAWGYPCIHTFAEVNVLFWFKTFLRALEVQIRLCQWLWLDLPLLYAEWLFIEKSHVNAAIANLEYNQPEIAPANMHSSTWALATIQRVLSSWVSMGNNHQQIHSLCPTDVHIIMEMHIHKSSNHPWSHHFLMGAAGDLLHCLSDKDNRECWY